MPRSPYASDGQAHRAAAVSQRARFARKGGPGFVFQGRGTFPFTPDASTRIARPTARSDSPTDKAAEVGPLRPTGPRLRSASAEPGRRPLPVVVEIFRPRPSPIARRGPPARVCRFGSQPVGAARPGSHATSRGACRARRRSVNAVSVSVAGLTRPEGWTRVGRQSMARRASAR